MFHTAVIALGSNLANPIEQIQNAIKRLNTLPEIQSMTVSSLYRTAPVGYTEQPDFINAVAIIHTTFSPYQLLHALQDIEQQFGRERSFRNAPRTLDLDIIDFSGEIYNQPELTLPHPRAHERGFVMHPLAEIAPDYPIGHFGNAQQLSQKLGNDGIEKII